MFGARKDDLAIGCFMEFCEVKRVAMSFRDENVNQKKQKPEDALCKRNTFFRTLIPQFVWYLSHHLAFTSPPSTSLSNRLVFYRDCVNKALHN